MNLHIRKKLFSLLMASSIALTSSSYGEIVNTNDEVKTTKNVNMRLSPSLDGQVISRINKDEVIYRIFRDDKWNLVLYNNKLGYVLDDFIEKTGIAVEDVEHYLCLDKIMATCKVNMRISPSLDSQKIGSVSSSAVCSVLAKTSNGWYLIKYQNKIGYSSCEFFISVTDYVNTLFPEVNLNEIKPLYIAYATSGLNVRVSNSKESYKIGALSKYESMIVLKELDDWYFVQYNGFNFGYVMKEWTKKMEGVFVLIDISEQTLWLYHDNEVILETSVTTGKSDTPTNIGLFKIYAKEEGRYLTGEDYKSWVNYWMPFDGGIGLHDASWRKKFGGDIYIMHGSHGCVNIPKELVPTIYDNVSVGTKVLVHK